MRKGFFFGVWLTLFLAAGSVRAADVDVVQWLGEGYVGIGVIDMQKLPQRKIFTDLMHFFVTDDNAKQALSHLNDAGLNYGMLTRVVVGIPNDVEKSEHIIFWESKESLQRFVPVVDKYRDELNVRTYRGVTYYCTKRQNECFTFFDTLLILGSERQVRAMLDVRQSNLRVRKNGPLAHQAELADKTKDVWFAFALTDSERTRIGRADPIVDMSSEGLGKLNFSDLRAGHFSLDFSTGLAMAGALSMAGEASASALSGIVSKLMADALNSLGVKELGVDVFIRPIKIGAKKATVNIAFSYSQAVFDQLIALVTDLAKSVPATQASPSTKK